MSSQFTERIEVCARISHNFVHLLTKRHLCTIRLPAHTNEHIPITVITGGLARNARPHLRVRLVLRHLPHAEAHPSRRWALSLALASTRTLSPTRTRTRSRTRSLSRTRTRSRTRSLSPRLPAQTHLDEYLIFSFARHPVDKFESAVRQFWLQQEKRNETLGQPLQATSP